MERFVSGMFATAPNEEALHDALAHLDVPGAVCYGAHDRSSARDDAEIIATEVFDDGSLVVFEESGHVPFIEQEERFNEELIEFLASTSVDAGVE